MKLYWTYSKRDLRPCDLYRHEKGKVKYSTDKYHIGGLQREPIFTHCICSNGILHVLEYCPGNEIHLAIIGGVNDDFIYANTANREQLFTLGNLVRFYLSIGEPVIEGDLSNFDLKTWLKAINK